MYSNVKDFLDEIERSSRQSTNQRSEASPPEVSSSAESTPRRLEPHQHRACPVEHPVAVTAAEEDGAHVHLIITLNSCWIRLWTLMEFGSHLLRAAVETLRRLQDVLSTLQMSSLSIADITELLLQSLQLNHFLILTGTEQGSNLLVQLHVHRKPLL